MLGYKTIVDKRRRKGKRCYKTSVSTFFFLENILL